MMDSCATDARKSACLGVYPTPSPEPKARSGHGLPCTLKQNALRATLKQNTRVTCASSPRALPGLRARAVGDAHRAREGAAAVHGQRRQQYGLKRFVGHFLTGADVSRLCVGPLSGPCKWH